MSSPKIFLSTISLFFILMGCKTYQAGLDQPNLAHFSDPPEVIKESLFNDRNSTISEESIQRLLDGEIEIQDDLRIAVLNYSPGGMSRYYNSYRQNEEYLKLQQEYIDKIRKNLENSERVSKAFLMPSIMVGGNASITQLREAAVRLQADMLLIFSLKSDIYSKYRAFAKDEAKAFATNETLLMDIRTGVIPFSNVVTRDTLIKKGENDFNMIETQKKAENLAILATLEQVGVKLIGFLEE